MDSQELLQVAADFFSSHQLPLWRASDNRLAGMVNGKNGRWGLHVVADDSWIAVRSLLCVSAPPAQQAAVMEYFTLANYGLRIGRFEMDSRDGELAFSAGLFVADGVLTEGMLGALVSAVLVTTDVHLPAILRVLYAGQEPALAYRQTMQPDAVTPGSDGALADLLSGLEQALEQLGDPPGD